MDDTLEKLNYIDAPLIRCDAPIGQLEITKLIQSLPNKGIFQSAWTFSSDGTPVTILQALDIKMFRYIKRNPMRGVLVWSWDVGHGLFFSFSLVTGEKKASMPRTFIPANDPLLRKVLLDGRIIFSVTHDGKISRFYQADFGNHPKKSDMLKGLRLLQDVYKDDVPQVQPRHCDYWSLMVRTDTNWYQDLPNKDKVRAQWWDSYSTLSDLDSSLNTFRKEHTKFPADINTESHIKNNFPFYHEIIEGLLNQEMSGHKLVNHVSEKLMDKVLAGDLIGGHWKLNIPETYWIINELILGALLSPEITQEGLRRPWLDGRHHSGDVVVKFIDLDVNRIAPESAVTCWLTTLPHLFDLGVVTSAKDHPVDLGMLHSVTLKLDSNTSIEDATETIHELVAETKENRQWAIPWGAIIGVDLSEFPYLELYQLDDEIHGLFRDRNERFFRYVINLDTGHLIRPELGSEEVELALGVILAAVVRDFLVVEERHKLFKTRAMKKRSANKANPNLSVVYLPRVRYITPDVANYHSSVGEKKYRTTHKVDFHFRRSESSSAQQKLLALRYNLTIPSGYTFVKPHKRGHLASKEVRREYRSRSASQLIFHALDEKINSKQPEWFVFETDIKNLFRKLGLSVSHTSANRNGDGGVDVVAYDEKNDIAWAIQAKCWATHRRIGPDIIRELKGSLHRFPPHTRGMVITTSSFTDGAKSLADEMEIETIDGIQFEHMLSKQEKGQNEVH